MTGLTRDFFMNARGHCLLDFGVAILAGSSALDMTHAALAGLVAIYAFDLFADVNVLGKSRRLGEFFSEITVASSALHGSRVADEGAPAAAGAVRRRRRAAESMTAALTRRRIVTIQTACMADVAYLLFDNGLFAGERDVDLLDDIFGVLE